MSSNLDPLMQVIDEVHTLLEQLSERTPVEQALLIVKGLANSGYSITRDEDLVVELIENTDQVFGTIPKRGDGR